MIRSFQLRLNPTKMQISAFEEILRDSCETYNAALQERIEAWKLQRKSITYVMQCAELTELRKDKLFSHIAVDIQRDPLRRVQRAFENFYRRCKSAGAPGFPRFRARHRYNSFTVPLTTRWSTPCDSSGLRLPRLGTIKFKTHRLPCGQQKRVIIKRVGIKWIAHIVCDLGPSPEKCIVSSATGIDFGLIDFVTLSSGSSVAAPKFIRKHAQAIARAQKNLARKVRGSNNRLRAKEAVRRSYQRMTNARENFTHHISKSLIRSYDLIVHEDLHIANMARGPFAKSILDAAWGKLLIQLAYKAEEAGKHVVAVNPRNTSQMCSGCGEIVRKKLSERTHACPCGTVLGRDHNAAINVLRLGRSLVGCSAEESGRSLPYLACGSIGGT